MYIRHIMSDMDTKYLQRFFRSHIERWMADEREHTGEEPEWRRFSIAGFDRVQTPEGSESYLVLARHRPDFMGCNISVFRITTLQGDCTETRYQGDIAVNPDERCVSRCYAFLDQKTSQQFVAYLNGLLEHVGV